MDESEKIQYAAAETQSDDLKFEIFQLNSLLTYAITECPDLVDTEQALSYREELEKRREVLDEIQSAELDPTRDLNVEVDRDEMWDLVTEIRSFLRSEVTGDA